MALKEFWLLPHRARTSVGQPYAPSHRMLKALATMFDLPNNGLDAEYNLAPFEHVKNWVQFGDVKKRPPLVPREPPCKVAREDGKGGKEFSVHKR